MNPLMTKILLLVSLVTLPALSIQAEQYNQQDVMRLLSIDLSNKVEPLKEKKCKKMHFMLKPLCEELKAQLVIGLDGEGMANIGIEGSAYKSYQSGDFKLREKYYLQELSLDFNLNTRIPLSFSRKNGQQLDDLYYPVFQKIYFNGEVNGSGTAEYRYTIVGLTLLGKKIEVPYKKDVGVDAEGSFNGDFYIAIAFNPHFYLDSEKNEFIITAQPKLRLIPDNFNYDVSLDVKSGGLSVSLLEAIDGAVNLSKIIPDLTKKERVRQIKNRLRQFAASAAGSFVNTYLLFEDAAGNPTSKALITFLKFLYDNDIDRKVDRLFYDQEAKLQKKLLSSLGANSEGLVVKRVPLGKVYGQQFAKILPAIMTL